MVTLCCTTVNSSSGSSSLTAVSVTVWVLAQLPIVKIKVSGDAVTTSSPSMVKFTVASWEGLLDNLTV